MPAPDVSQSPPANPLDREQLRARVAALLEGWLTELDATLAAVDPDCAALADSIGALLRGGKRVRAGFCYWGWRGTGEEGGEPIVTVATAMELVQAAALLHDDIMDASDTRRGLPSAHRQLQASHHLQEWRGDAARFGESAALLAGDLCLAASAQFLHRATAQLAPDRAVRGLRVYDDMIIQLMAGQYLDILAGARPAEPDPEAMARRVIRYKTINYTVDRPLALGATLAGAEEALLAAYTGYAANVGEAFQLRDDVLGVFGDPSRTGKPAGDDLREGKQTVLTAVARAAATPAELTLLNRLGQPDLTDGDIAELTSVLAERGLPDVEERIERLAGQARRSLDDAPIASQAREVLLDLVNTATRRHT